MLPEIYEHELQQVVKILKIINPGRCSESFILSRINMEWPFDNISTGGFVAYAESPDRTNKVRIALTPYSVSKYLFPTG